MPYLIKNLGTTSAVKSASKAGKPPVFSRKIYSFSGGRVTYYVRPGHSVQFSDEEYAQNLPKITSLLDEGLISVTSTGTPGLREQPNVVPNPHQELTPIAAAAPAPLLEEEPAAVPSEETVAPIEVACYSCSLPEDAFVLAEPDETSLEGMVADYPPGYSPEPPENGPTDWGAMSINDLRNSAKVAGLNAGGSKADLIERLTNADKAKAEEAEAEE